MNAYRLLACLTLVLIVAPCHSGDEPRTSEAIHPSTEPFLLEQSLRVEEKTNVAVMTCKMPFPENDDRIEVATAYLRIACSEDLGRGTGQRFAEYDYEPSYGGVIADQKRRVLTMEIRLVPTSDKGISHRSVAPIELTRDERGSVIEAAVGAVSLVAANPKVHRLTAQETTPSGDLFVTVIFEPHSSSRGRSEHIRMGCGKYEGEDSWSCDQASPLLTYRIADQTLPISVLNYNWKDADFDPDETVYSLIDFLRNGVPEGTATSSLTDEDFALIYKILLLDEMEQVVIVGRDESHRYKLNIVREIGEDGASVFWIPSVQ